MDQLTKNIVNQTKTNIQTETNKLPKYRIAYDVNMSGEGVPMFGESGDYPVNHYLIAKYFSLSRGEIAYYAPKAYPISQIDAFIGSGYAYVKSSLGSSNIVYYPCHINTFGDTISAHVVVGGQYANQTFVFYLAGSFIYTPK